MAFASPVILTTNLKERTLSFCLFMFRVFAAKTAKLAYSKFLRMFPFIFGDVVIVALATCTFKGD